MNWTAEALGSIAAIVAVIAQAPLQSLFKSLGGSRQRKTVMLLSAGLPDADRADARPSLGAVMRSLGQSAAQANLSIHALYFDRFRADRLSASKQVRRP